MFFLIIIGFSCESESSIAENEDATNDNVETNDEQGDWVKLADHPQRNFRVQKMLANDESLFVLAIIDTGMSFWRLNLESKDWEMLSDMGQDVDLALVGTNLFWYNDKPNIITGDNSFGSPQDFWYQFDLETLKWQEINYDNNQYFVRAGSAFWLVDDNVYMALGDVSRDEELFYFPRYNISNDEVTLMQNIPNVGSSPVFPKGFLWNGKICLILRTLNGVKDTGTKKLLEYDIDKNEWKTKDITIPGGGRSEFLVFVVNNMLYVGAGYKDSGWLKDMYKYDYTNLDSPERVGDIPEVLTGTVNTVFENRAYVTRKFYSTQYDTPEIGAIFQLSIGDD